MQDAPLYAAAPHLTSQWRRLYAQRLARWYAQHHRDLPWRRTRDPYAIWISETMLQQTQVATVIDYYHRFLARFPTVDALAAADEQEVLGLWAGLGYYRRARQLHAASRQVVSLHGGVFPDDINTLMTLPGIGRYTAGAIASIAFDQPAPILEANTERVYARLLCLTQPTRTPAALATLWQFAQWSLTRSSRTTVQAHASPRVINQAAMELGSLICKPLNPLCAECPLADLCPTAQRGLQHAIPAPKPKKTFTQLHHVALIVPSGDRWLLRLSPPGSWWTGLWDFPRVDITESGLIDSQASDTRGPEAILEPAGRKRIAQVVHETLGLQSEIGSPRFSLTHTVTRYRIRLHCVDAVAAGFSSNGRVREPTVKAAARDRLIAPSGWQWCTFAELAELPLTAPARKIAGLLEKADS